MKEKDIRDLINKLFPQIDEIKEPLLLPAPEPEYADPGAIEYVANIISETFPGQRVDADAIEEVAFVLDKA